MALTSLMFIIKAYLEFQLLDDDVVFLSNMSWITPGGGRPIVASESFRYCAIKLYLPKKW